MKNKNWQMEVISLSNSVHDNCMQMAFYANLAKKVKVKVESESVVFSNC